MALARDRPNEPGITLSKADALVLALCQRWLDKLYPELLGFYRSQRVDYDDAQDLISRAFERAWKRVQKYPALRVETAVRSVTFKAANRVLKEFQAEQRRVKGREFIAADEDLDLASTDDLQALVEGSDARERADIAIAELADQQQEVIRLVEQGYSINEIAERIISAFNSAKTQTSRARKKLRQKLKLILKDAGFNVPDEPSHGGLDDD